MYNYNTISLCRNSALLCDIKSAPNPCHSPLSNVVPIPFSVIGGESCIINYRVYILSTDFRMSSSRGRKRRALAARSGSTKCQLWSETDCLGTTPRTASTTTTSRSVAKSTRSSSAAAFNHGTSSSVAPPPIISAVATSHPMPSACRPAVVVGLVLLPRRHA